MMRLLISGCIVVLVVGAIWASCSSVVSSEVEAPTPDLIAAALRIQGSSPLELTYTVTASCTKTESPPLEMKYDYVRTPEMLSETESTSDGRVTGRFSYDVVTGEYRKLFLPASGDASGEVDCRIGRPFYSRHQMETAFYCTLEGEPLVDVIGRGSVSQQPDEVDGHSCWRVELTATSTGIRKYVVWVDPDIGFCPRRIQICWNGPEIASDVTDFLDYREVADNVWFPMTLVSSAEDPQFGKVTNTCRATSVKIGTTKNKNTLRVTFPPGTEVYDRSLDAIYTVP